MSKNRKDRRKVIARRHRPRPGQRQTRLTQVAVSVSEAAERLLPQAVYTAMAREHIDQAASDPPGWIRTSNFEHDGRLFAIQSIAGKGFVYVCLDHEKAR